MQHPEIKRLIKAGLSDQEAAIRLASVNLLAVRIEEARKEILTARDEIMAANRRVKQASATVADIERLNSPAPSVPSAPTCVPAPLPLDAHLPILPRPTPRLFSGLPWPDALALTETEYDPLG